MQFRSFQRLETALSVEVSEVFCSALPVRLFAGLALQL